MRTRRATGTVNTHARAFTLVELLVVIGIIAVLIGLLIPVVSRARKAAKQAAVLSAMRDIMFGYTAYHIDHKGTLFWGYPPAFVNGQMVKVGLPTGQTLPDTAGGFFASTSLTVIRYPARLAPFQPSVWSLLYNHMEPSALPDFGDSSDVVGEKIYKISLYPSFGLNTIFMGGDQDFDGFPGMAPDQRPNFGAHAAFKASDVRRPSEQLVFVESQEKTTGGRSENGYFRVMPPVAKGRRWRASASGDQVETVAPGGYGIPCGRWSTRAVTGFFDGHASTLTMRELEDMRIWAKDAKTADYDYKTAVNP